MPSLIRLYSDVSLQTGMSALLDPAHGHYLRQVMRRAEGDEIEIFNGRDGAFTAKITALTKKLAQVEVGPQSAKADNGCKLVLWFAPIKRTPLEFMVQKATELGVSVFAPVRSDRTIVKGYNQDRLGAIMIEASEQCERVSIPRFEIETPLVQRLNSLDYPLLFADEAGDDPGERWGGSEGRANPMLKVLDGFKPDLQGKIGILIGPEGGFTSEERSTLRAHHLAYPISLGSRILRAETAAISALSVLQAKIDFAASGASE